MPSFILCILKSQIVSGTRDPEERKRSVLVREVWRGRPENMHLLFTLIT